MHLTVPECFLWLPRDEENVSKGNPNLNEENVLELIANGFTSKEFKAHPVSSDLYKRNLDTNKPYIIEEITPLGLLF